jgi:hypothetical protein
MLQQAGDWICHVAVDTLIGEVIAIGEILVFWRGYEMTL